MEKLELMKSFAVFRDLNMVLLIIPIFIGDILVYSIGLLPGLRILTYT